MAAILQSGNKISQQHQNPVNPHTQSSVTCEHWKRLNLFRYQVWDSNNVLLTSSFVARSVFESLAGKAQYRVDNKRFTLIRFHLNPNENERAA
jgi:hypothetical protein